jgi:S-adenosylmethionine decarboxylase
MAFNDTLFQLGMDLTRSSTAQKEDLNDVVRLAHEDCQDSFVERESARTTTQRIIVDLFGARRVESAKSVERALKEALEFAKGRVLRSSLSRNKDTGCVSGIVTMADGLVSVEVCPASGCVAVDLESYVGMRPELVLTALTDAFDAREAVIKKQRSEADMSKLRATARHYRAQQTPRLSIAKASRARKAA